MKILITGAAGFIGYHLARRLLADGYIITGVDNFNDYYDVQLKRDRLADLQKNAQSDHFSFYEMELADIDNVANLFAEEKFTHIVHLAAQAGVRYSLKNPYAYINSNVLAFENILEGCRNNPVEHLVFASSSSVYGLNSKRPYSVQDNVDHPVSLYAATKKSNELMAHAYSHLFDIPSTGLRFFTVYGPWGRPDMALHLFTTAILTGKPIKVFNNGKMRRDFTYIDDIIEGVVRILFLPPKKDPSRQLTPATSSAPWRIFNIGNNHCVELNDFIATIEKVLSVQAKKELMPMQSGDVEATWADIDDLATVTGFCPSTPLEEGIRNFVSWYRNYYKL